MDKIVEGTRRGIPEFYIVIRKEGKEQKSFFLLDEEEQERDVFCVRSFGFDNQGFMEFYRKLRWIVPGRTRIIGTKTQEVWKLRRRISESVRQQACFLGYVLPKTPGNDVWVTSYMKENRSEAEIERVKMTRRKCHEMVYSNRNEKR